MIKILSTSVVTMLFLSLAMRAIADPITPVDVKGTSEFGAVDVFGDGNLSDVFVTDLIDGEGLIDLEETPDNILDDYHDNDVSWTNGWHSGDMAAGLTGGLDDGDTSDDDPLTAPPVAAQVLEFDLGGLFLVESSHIWQQNQGGFFGSPLAPNRGVELFEILVSQQGSGDTFTSVGKFELDFEEGLDVAPAQIFKFDEARLARRVRLDILSAHSGDEREFVGLAEVRFEGESRTVPGDFDGNTVLDADDIHLLSCAIQDGSQDAVFDLNGDQLINRFDRDFWVAELKNTYYGDADFDGEFNSGDLVSVFATGEYEDEIKGNSSWSSGDWDGSKDFDSSDFVIAFADGGYELGPRPDEAAVVPEPSGAMLIAGLLGGCIFWSRRRQNDA